MCADWYEGAVLQIDAVLQDLIAVVHPSQCIDHKFTWFRNLPNNDPVVIVTAAECTDISAPLSIDTSQCKPQYAGLSCVWSLILTFSPATLAPTLLARRLQSLRRRSSLRWPCSRKRRGYDAVYFPPFPCTADPVPPSLTSSLTIVNALSVYFPSIRVGRRV